MARIISDEEFDTFKTLLLSDIDRLNEQIYKMGLEAQSIRDLNDRRSLIDDKNRLEKILMKYS
jgi:hypothetical protein